MGKKKKREREGTLTIVDFPIPLGPRIPIRDSRSIPKFTLRNRMRSGEYLRFISPPFLYPNVTSLDCRMGICSGGGYASSRSPGLTSTNWKRSIGSSVGAGIASSSSCSFFTTFSLLCTCLASTKRPSPTARGSRSRGSG